MFGENNLNMDQLYSFCLSVTNETVDLVTKPIKYEDEFLSHAEIQRIKEHFKAYAKAYILLCADECMDIFEFEEEMSRIDRLINMK